MLKLICGPSGSGKSYVLRERIRRDMEAGQRAFLIVPEQQVYFYEQELLPVLPGSAGRILKIVGFRRLAELVFRETGGLTETDPDEGLRTLFMWQNLRELSPLLSEYRPGDRPDQSLTALMLSVSDEMHAGGVSPAALEGAAGKLPEDDPLRTKLLDLSLITAAYDGLVTERFGGNSADRLFRLGRVLRTCPFFRGSRVYLDSFTDFTEGEYAVLGEMLRQAEHVTVTLDCMGLSDHSPETLAVATTAARLSAMGNELAGGCETELLKGNHRTQSEELHLIGKHLFDMGLRRENLPLPAEDKRGAIELYAPAGPYAEAELAAKRILALHEEGMHFGEIAVIVRDTEDYRGLIDSVFDRYGIPCFLSEKRELSSEPPARFILSSLRAAGRGFRREDVMTLAKTGLTGLGERDLDLFEEYCGVWNITGNTFTEPVWNRNPDGYTTRLTKRGKEILESANRVRATLIPPLEKLGTGLRAAGTLADKCAVLYDYLLEAGLTDRLLSLAETELSLGEIREAGDTVRLFDAVVGALTRLADVLPDAEMNTEEFTSAISLLLSASDIGAVPEIQDCVIIGAADTLRVENLRAALVLGLTEGAFPAPVKSAGLLGDAEKAKLDELGVRFGTRRDKMSANELYYIRRAFTKPKEKLILSAPTAAADGKALTPSIAFARVRYLFPYLGVTEYKLAPAVSHPQSAGYTVSPALADGILGNTLRFSPTNLQRFNSCPHSYWSTYIMRLRLAQPAVFGSLDAGNFLHFVLEHYLRGCIGEDGIFRLPDDAERERRVAQAARDCIRESYPELDASPDELHTHLFRRYLAAARLMAASVTEELRHSEFVPAFFEKKIGDGDADIPPLDLTIASGRNAGKKLRLGGTVDRVDVFRREGQIYLRVVDYKSGNHTFSMKDVKEGRDLQLLLYLFTLCRGKDSAWFGDLPEGAELLPAGAFFLYMNREGQVPRPERSGLVVMDPELLHAMNDEMNSAFLCGVKEKKDGTYSGNAMESADFDRLGDEIGDSLLSSADRLFSGDASKTPSAKSCKFCLLADACPVAVKGGF